MLNELKIDELLDKVDSRYGLVVAVARRARQINEYTATLGIGESIGVVGPQVHTHSQHPLSIAIEELRAGKFTVSLAEDEDQEGEEESQEADASRQADSEEAAHGAA